MILRDDSDEGFAGSFPRGAGELEGWHARAPHTSALEPELPIVDPHHHLFGSPQDALYYRIEDLRQDLASGHRFLGTVYVEAYESGWRRTGPQSMRPVGEIEMIMAATAAPVRTRHGACHAAAGIVSHVDLTLGDGVPAVIEEQLKPAGGRLRGVRHRAATDEGAFGSFIKNRPKPGLMLGEEYKRGMAHLHRFGLAFDAWIYHTQIGDLIELADEYPDLPMILNHAGAPIGVAQYRHERAEVLERWNRDMRALAARPNVCVKLGGMGMTMFGFGFERGTSPPSSAELTRAWQPFIDTCIEAFGTDRCMFESNFPVDKQSCSYVELWNAFKLATRALSIDERRDLFYRTACRTYRLPELMRLGDEASERLNHETWS